MEVPLQPYHSASTMEVAMKRSSHAAPRINSTRRVVFRRKFFVVYWRVLNMPLKTETLIAVALVFSSVVGIVLGCTNTVAYHNCPNGAVFLTLGSYGSNSCSYSPDTPAACDASSNCAIRRRGNVVQMLKNGAVVEQCLGNGGGQKKCVAWCRTSTGHIVRGAHLCTLAPTRNDGCSTCTSACNRYNP